MRKGDIIAPGGIRRRVRRIQPIRGGLKVWSTVIDKAKRQAIPPAEQGKPIYIMTEADHAAR